MPKTLRWAIAPLAALLLAGCGGGGDDKSESVKAVEPSSRTLTAEVKAGGEYGALARVAENAGLDTALDGVGPYTLFAPPEAAIKGGAADFTDPSLKAEGAALLRAHIVPGTLTRADIAAAIDRGGANGAKMRTMDGALLTFSRNGDTIVVTAPDGASVRLSGAESLVSNGVLQPVDGLLVKPAPVAAAAG